MFPDRIEILSRGTIPPGQTMEGFFAGESVPVNQKLSDMLLQLHISERTGRGVPKITEVYGKGTYEFRENSIVVSIPFTRVSTEDEDPRWTQDRTQDRTQDGTQEDSKGSSEDEKIKRILEFCQTPKGILEITEMLGYSGRKPTKKYVKPLVEQGRLAMTIPDKPQSKNQKYVTVKWNGLQSLFEWSCSVWEDFSLNHLFWIYWRWHYGKIYGQKPYESRI